MSDLIAVVLFEMQELSLLIKADHPISSVELIDDPTKLHELHSRTFIDAQEFKLYRHIVTTFPHLSQDPDLPTANRPSIRVSCFVARGPMYFVWNVFFVLVHPTVLSLRLRWRRRHCVVTLSLPGLNTGSFLYL